MRKWIIALLAALSLAAAPAAAHAEELVEEGGTRAAAVSAATAEGATYEQAVSEVELQEHVEEAPGLEELEELGAMPYYEGSQLIVNVPPKVNNTTVWAILKKNGITTSEAEVKDVSFTRAGEEKDAEELDKALAEKISKGEAEVGIGSKGVEVTYTEPQHHNTDSFYERPGVGPGPLIAGQYYQTNTASCTLGFEGVHNGGQGYFLTAGHCSEERSKTEACTFWLKKFGEEKLGEAVGCAVFGEDVTGYQGLNGDYGLVVDNTAAEYSEQLLGWPIGTGYREGPPERSIPGEIVCHVGYRSASYNVGESCARISEYVWFTLEGKQESMWQTTPRACVYSGDSGGPVYSVYRNPMGILDDSYPHTGCKTAFDYTSVQVAERALGFKLG